MLAAVPPGVPNLINHASVRAFNEMWFRKAPRRRQGEIQSITRFFHPLDGIAAWNRVYGRRGLPPVPVRGAVRSRRPRCAA